MRKTLVITGILTLLFGGFSVAHAQEKMDKMDAASAPLTAQTPVIVPGAAGRYDYMAFDAPKRRLLAGHTGTSSLMVYDVDSKDAPRSIPMGVDQSVAIDEADNRYFCGISKEQKVVALDRTTLEKVGELAVTGPVDAIAYDPKNQKVYACHDDEGEVWVVDPKALTLVGTVKISGAPEWVQYEPTTDRVYQAVKTTDVVHVINPTTYAVEKTFSTTPLKSTHGMAIDGTMGRLFVSASNGKFAVLDIKSGKVLQTIDIAPGVDQMVYDPEMHRVYCACRGVISVVEVTKKGAKKIADVPDAKGVHTIAVDPKTHAVWTCYADDKNSYIQQFTTK